jgi:DNA-binding response OmpR family regulator
MPRCLRVLVVEDEMMIALMLEDMLLDMGHDVVGLAMRLPQALALAQAAEIDLAILDVNLDGRLSFPVAEVLDRRGVPFFFASGYGSAGVEPPFEGRLTIRKPFEIKDLRGAIARFAG